MKYGTEYRCEWKMMEDENDSAVANIRYSIFDTEHLIEDDEEVNVITLEGTGNPCTITVLDHDKDKFTPIRAKKARLEFRSEPGKHIGTFCDSADSRWYVEVTIPAEGETLFIGFLSLDDMQQDFLPDPTIVVLTASDGLGILRDIPWTLDDGTNPIGKYKIGTIIAHCLKKTGLGLSIKAIHNLRHGSGQTVYFAQFAPFLNAIYVSTGTGTNYFYPGQILSVSGTGSNNGEYTVTSSVFSGGTTTVLVEEDVNGEIVPNCQFSDSTGLSPMYDSCYLDAKTFEDEIGKCEDCYTVLSKILGEDSFLYQFNGAWWISRVDEYDLSSSNALKVQNYTEDGIYLGEAVPLIEYNKVIAADQEIKALSDRLIETQRSKGEVKITYLYNYPLEIPANRDFINGELTETISALEKHYHLDNWKLFRNTPPEATDLNEVYIKRIFHVNGYETERYIVIGVGDVSGFYYIESERIPIQQSDRFNFSVDHRYNGQIETAAGLIRPNIAQIRLYATDGTFYTLFGGNSIDPRPRWVETNSTFTGAGSRFFHTEFDGTEDDTQWRTAGFWTGDCPDIPKTGELTILLCHNIKTDEFEIHYNNLQFDYIPRINGGYTKFKSQEHTISRDRERYRAKRESQVGVSDSPKPLIKGAMFYLNSLTEFHSATTNFTAPNTFILPGDRRSLFYLSKTFRISGTFNNNDVFTVLSCTYDGTTNTTVTVKENTLNTSATQPAVFYNAAFYQTVKFFPFNVFFNNEPPQDAIKPYGKVQVYSVWNQFRNHVRIFSGSVLGLYVPGQLPYPWCDLVFKYYLSDPNSNTDNRQFLCVGFDQNWKTGAWKGTFIEVFNSVQPKNYEDNYEFEYLSE
jgi:hypothetical protein